MAARRSVLICGGGIAGATLACLLGRSGHAVALVEQDQGVRSSGNPVDVRGPAFDVVARLGVLPRLRELATRVRRLVVVDAAGRPVAALSTRRDPDRELEIPRSDLAAALLTEAEAVAEVRFDETIEALASDAGGVDVTLARGGARRVDLVVGADGLHSRVRRLAFGPDGEFVTPLGMFVATLVLGDAGTAPDTVLLHNEPGAATALHPGRDRGGVAFLFRSRRAVDLRDRAATDAVLAERYAGAGWRVPELLAAYAAAEDVWFDAVSRVRVPAWSRGAVTLLGDAASCISLFGEGSSAAVQGAAALAGALDRTSRDVPAALARYEATHRPVVRRLQRGAPVAAHLLVPASPAGLALRDRALRAAARLRLG